MDNFEPPNADLLQAISTRNDNLKPALIALYLRYITQDLGNDILGNTPERIPDVANFMKELAEKEGLPGDIIESIGAFSSQSTTKGQKKLIDAINRYLEPYDDEENILGETYLNLQYPDRPAKHETE